MRSNCSPEQSCKLCFRAVSSNGTRPTERSQSFGRGAYVLHMKFTVYVLKDLYGKVYKGMTNNFTRRLQEHNAGHTITTSKMRGLSVAHLEEFDNFEDARKRELYFKSAAGRRFLKKKIGPMV